MDVQIYQMLAMGVVVFLLVYPAAHIFYLSNGVFELMEELESRVSGHQAAYLRLEAESAELHPQLEKRVVRSLFEAYMIQSVVRRISAEIEGSLVKFSPGRLLRAKLQLEKLLAGEQRYGAYSETLDLSTLAGWESRLQVRHDFIKQELGRLKAQNRKLSAETLHDLGRTAVNGCTQDGSFNSRHEFGMMQ